MKKDTPKTRQKRNIGEEILGAINEIKAGGGKRYTVHGPDDIKRVRKDLKLSQTDFAQVLHISERTLQAWEQGQRSPSGAAIALLTIAAARPDIVRHILKPQ